MTATPTELAGHACRSCGATALVEILSLGRVPLANALLCEDQVTTPAARHPLDLAVCPACSLVQLVASVPPEQLFTEYLYFSSFSDSFLAHAAATADRICQQMNLGANSLVVEIGSNDGYLLQYFKQRGIPVLGIEPARNIACHARDKRGVNTLTAFFDLELARQLMTQGYRADVIIANNVLAHVPDPNDFLAGVRLLLKPGGVVNMEVPYVLRMLDEIQFDTIYHEHLCYFSVCALDHLFRRNGLPLRGIRPIPFHGGSLQLHAGHHTADGSDPQIARMIAHETDRHIYQPASYRAFADRINGLRTEVIELLDSLNARNRSVAAYGAAAKGTMLLNVFGLGRNRVTYVVDRNPAKQGRYIPGTLQPVHSPDVLSEAPPDYLLLLAWNVADEIMAQQRRYAEKGGRFIIPIPRCRIVEPAL